MVRREGEALLIIIGPEKASCDRMELGPSFSCVVPVIMELSSTFPSILLEGTGLHISQHFAG